MRNYIIRRALLIIPTLLLSTFIVFGGMRLIPGTIIDMLAMQHEYSNADEVPQTRATIMHELGFDTPIYVQYWHWLSSIVAHGDFGYSMWGQQRSVFYMISSRWYVSLGLNLMALIIGNVLGISLGIYAAVRQDSILDYIGRSMSILFIAIPGFWLGTLIMVFPAIWWNWSPRIDLAHLTTEPLANLGMYLVPAVIMGVGGAGGMMRIMRTMMLECMRQDYVRTAWSKGLRERAVVLRHVVKNACLPIITIVGGSLPGLIGGSVIMEAIFGLPGIGLLFLGSINTRDYPVIMGLMFIGGTIGLICTLLTDVSYAWVDPRIRYH